LNRFSHRRCAKAISSSWTTCAPTRSTAYAKRLRRSAPRCAICQSPNSPPRKACFRFQSAGRSCPLAWRISTSLRMRGAAEKSYRTQFQQQLGLQFGIASAGGNDGGADRPQPLLEQQPGRHQMVRPGVERDVDATNAGGFEYHVHAVSGRIIAMGRFKDRAGRDEDVAQFADRRTGSRRMADRPPAVRATAPSSAPAAGQGRIDRRDRRAQARPR
jgi:hypothetical protein